MKSGVYLIFGTAIIFFGIEFLLIKYGGQPVPVPQIQKHMVFGDKDKKKLRYLIIGDSTAIGQGANYTDSYAYKTAEHMGQTRQVDLLNVGVSGARVADVRRQQIKEADGFTPDVVLLAVGANDVTHLTRRVRFEQDLKSIIQQLKQKNPQTVIVVTGVPAMGSVHRFPWPVRQFAGVRTEQLNSIYSRLIQDYDLVYAPIAEQTAEDFARNPVYFAKDGFHPNAAGYELWAEIIIQTIINNKVVQ